MTTPTVVPFQTNVEFSVVADYEFKNEFPRIENYFDLEALKNEFPCMLPLDQATFDKSSFE